MTDIRFRGLLAHRSIEESWIRSDTYHNSFLIGQDDGLEHAIKNMDENGLPPIAVSTAEGKLLSLLVRSVGAKRVLEVGTLGGYVRPFLEPRFPALSTLCSSSCLLATRPSGSRARYLKMAIS